VPKTLLAVDDSTTMRKVLEITFMGEDFHVLTAEGGDAALAKMGEKPVAVVIDTVLGSEDGYSVCKQIRAKDGNAAIVMLASRYAPYDAAKGKDSGADDFIDKPFDTQQLIDKVKKVLLAREGAGAAAPAPVAAAAKPVEKATPAPAPVAAKPAPVAEKPRSQTLVFGEAAPSPAPPSAKQAPIDVPKPTPAAATPAPAPVAAAASAVSASVNGHLAGKLSDLGLNPSQADAVLALSREVVERVVWEVVPQLAEALIKEEITRLMKA
jgi:DNA-binding response OmpR family regulator